jgi:hypothetical protein
VWTGGGGYLGCFGEGGRIGLGSVRIFEGPWMQKFTARHLLAVGEHPNRAPSEEESAVPIAV